MGGFSASGATVVIFIGVLISAGIIFPVASNVWSQSHDAYTSQHDRQMMLDNTDFAVETEWDEPQGEGQDGTLEVTVTNTGTTALELRAITYQLDGALTEPDEQWVEVDDEEFDDRTYLRPGETLVAEFPLGEEPDRLQVTVETGQSQVVTHDG